MEYPGLYVVKPTMECNLTFPGAYSYSKSNCLDSLIHGIETYLSGGGKSGKRKKKRKTETPDITPVRTKEQRSVANLPSLPHPRCGCPPFQNRCPKINGSPMSIRTFRRWLILYFERGSALLQLNIHRTCSRRSICISLDQ